MFRRPTYERLLQAAEDEFAAAGYAGASIQSIARSAGISKASLFHYFPSKEEMYRAVIAHISTNLAGVFADEALPEPLPPNAMPMERVKAVVGRLHDFIALHPNYPRLLFHRILEDQQRVREGSKTLFKPFVDDSAEFIRRGTAAGVFREVDPVHAVLSILGLVMFFYAAAPLVEACAETEVFAAASIAARRRQILDQVGAMLAVNQSSR